MHGSEEQILQGEASRQRVKILGVQKHPSLFWHRLAKGEGPPVEIAAERFFPFLPLSLSFRATASWSSLLHVAGTQGERRGGAMDGKKKNKEKKKKKQNAETGVGAQRGRRREL